MQIQKPLAADYPDFFATYINKVLENDLQEAFKNQSPIILDFLQSFNEEKSSYAYAPGKWTLKELLQHTIDAERVFQYRAMCIARGETASLPSFDENLYAQNSQANVRSWKNLSDEFITVRKSTEDLFHNFTGPMFKQKGIANGKSMTVASLGFITVGHVTHHIKVAQQKYLS